MRGVFYEMSIYGVDMNNRLENLLSEYEKAKPITNDAELIEALESLLAAENSRTVEDMDADLIDEILKQLLVLQDIDLDKLNEHADLVTEKYLKELKEEKVENKVVLKKAKTIGRKWILPLVAVLSVMMITTVVVCGFGTDIATMSAEFFKELKENFRYKNTDNDYIKTGEFVEYHSFEDFLENDIADQILLPYKLFDEMKVNKIYLSYFGNYIKILIDFQMYEKQQEIDIVLPSQSSYDFSDKATMINRFNVHHYEFDEQYQGVFIYKENLYTITVSSYDIMEKIIYNLEDSYETNN